MNKTVYEFLKNFDTCQRNKHLTMSSAGLLQPLLLPSQVWEYLTMDFIEGLLKSEGVDIILVIIDCLSK